MGGWMIRDMEGVGKGGWRRGTSQDGQRLKILVSPVNAHRGEPLQGAC